MQLTQHFTVQEMECPCCQRCEMDPIFMGQLEKFRLTLNIPLIINSGFRCPQHNATLRDASPNSEHLRGRAADIRWADDKFHMLQTAMSIFYGIGIGKTYMHVDLGDAKKVWIY